MESKQGCRIILVRHGETEANRRGRFAESDETPLTETGRLQAHRLALRLAREFRPAALISSGFLRARETSEIIARTLALETEIIEGIQERDFGSLKGHPYERLADTIVPDLESEESVRSRAVAALEFLRVRYACQEIVVVSHGAVIRAICAHITGNGSDAVVPPNCGIQVIEYGKRGWTRGESG